MADSVVEGVVMGVVERVVMGVVEGLVEGVAEGVGEGMVASVVDDVEKGVGEDIVDIVVEDLVKDLRTLGGFANPLKYDIPINQPVAQVQDHRLPALLSQGYSSPSENTEDPLPSYCQPGRRYVQLQVTAVPNSIDASYEETTQLSLTVKTRWDTSKLGARVRRYAARDCPVELPPSIPLPTRDLPRVSLLSRIRPEHKFPPPPPAGSLPLIAVGLTTRPPHNRESPPTSLSTFLPHILLAINPEGCPRPCHSQISSPWNPHSENGQWVKRDRQGMAGGGVAVRFKEALQVQVLQANILAWMQRFFCVLSSPVALLSCPVDSYENLLVVQSLVDHVDFPTHIHGRMLDPLISDLQDDSVRCHQLQQVGDVGVKCDEASTRIIWPWNRADWSSMRRDLHDTDLNNRLLDFWIYSSFTYHIASTSPNPRTSPGLVIDVDLLQRSSMMRGSSRLTLNLLLLLSRDWQDALDNGLDTLVIALDISGAFDRMWHRDLLEKLRAKRIEGNLLLLPADYRRTLSVVVNYQTSRDFPIEALVPQGSVLGPILWNVYNIDSILTTSDNKCQRYQPTLMIELYPMVISSSPAAAYAVVDRILFEEVPLSLLDYMTILRVDFDKHLKFDKHFNNSDRKASRLGSPPWESPLDIAITVNSLEHRRDVAVPTVFRKAQVQEVPHLAGLRLPLRATQRSTRTMLSSFQLVEVPRSRDSQHQRAFIARVSRLWNLFTAAMPDVGKMTTQQVKMAAHTWQATLPTPLILLRT
ncbi:RNA-directed DNA polymerase from mobile element jockey-like 42, partial [Homarus americanus]